MDEFWGDLRGNPGVRRGVTLDEVASVAWGQVYVATPYSRRVRDAGGAWLGASIQCAQEAAAVCEALVVRGVSALSPIVLAQACIGARLDRGADPVAVRDWALDEALWTGICARWLVQSQFLFVADLPGWRESAGVRHEVEAFLGLSRPVLIGGVL